jgi:hypothetical protein
MGCNYNIMRENVINIINIQYFTIHLKRLFRSVLAKLNSVPILFLLVIFSGTAVKDAIDLTFSYIYFRLVLLSGCILIFFERNFT